jgi:hypothetical protein
MRLRMVSCSATRASILAMMAPLGAPTLRAISARAFCWSRMYSSAARPVRASMRRMPEPMDDSPVMITAPTWPVA